MSRAVGWRAQTPPKVKFSRIYTMTNWDVPDIKWVERHVVGISNLDRPLTSKEIDQQMRAVNRALRYGKIVAIEQNFHIVTVGKKDTIAQYTVYHVGFKNRPKGK